MILCERAGIRRFVVAAAPEAREAAHAALGSFRDRPEVGLVDSLTQGADTIDPAAICVRFDGNLVLAPSVLRRALDQYAASPGAPVNLISTDEERGGTITVGPLRSLLGIHRDSVVVRPSTTAALPFALNGRPEDREEAELRLARAVRNESLSTDALMARVFDRRLSWRISLPLARMRVAPNAV